MSVAQAGIAALLLATAMVQATTAVSCAALPALDPTARGELARDITDCAAQLEASPSIQALESLLIGVRKAQSVGLLKVSDAGLSAVRKHASAVSGPQRVDTTADLEPTECLPLAQTLPFDQELATTHGDFEAAERIRQVTHAATGRQLAGSDLDAALIDSVVQRSSLINCDEIQATIQGVRVQVLASSEDMHLLGHKAMSVPVHGWLFPASNLFVSDSGLSHLEQDLSHGRQLAVNSFNGEARARGKRTRLLVVVDFPDQSLAAEFNATFDGYAKAWRHTQWKTVAMSYGQWVGNDTMVRHIYRMVNMTFAQAVAQASASALWSAAEWIVANDPDPKWRYKFTDFDYVTISFPSISSFSWAGLASVSGRNEWLNGGYRAATYAMLHENGHNYGLVHAGFLDQGYGNVNDNMGCCAIGQWFSNRKMAMHWIPRSLTTELCPIGPSLACPHCSRGGAFFLWPHDVGVLPNSISAYVTAGSTVSPLRADNSNFSAYAQPGSIVTSISVPENLYDYARTAAKVWIDAKAEEASTGAGQVLLVVEQHSTTSAATSSLQSVRSRTEWENPGITRGNAYVHAGERFGSLITQVRVSDMALAEIAAGSRPAVLIEALAEHDAPRAGLLARGAPATAGAVALAAEPSPVPVPANFDSLNPPNRAEAVEDLCAKGLAGTATTPACSSIVRPVRVGFLGPSGERATLGIGCDLQQQHCDTPPALVDAHVQLEDGIPPQAAGPSRQRAIEAASSASAPLRYLGSTYVRFDKPLIEGDAPTRRALVAVNSTASSVVLAVLCAPQVRSSDELGMGVYHGDAFPHEIVRYGSEFGLSPSRIASSMSVDESARHLSDVGLNLTFSARVCGSAPSLSVVASTPSSLERADAVQSGIARGLGSIDLGSSFDLSTHGLPGSSFPGAFLALGYQRNHSATRPWAQAPTQPVGSIQQVQATLHLFSAGAQVVKQFDAANGYVLNGVFTLEPYQRNGRSVWRKGNIYVWWISPRWWATPGLQSGSYYERHTVDPSVDDGTIASITIGRSITITPLCSPGLGFSNRTLVGVNPRPFQGACVSCPSGTIGSSSGCVCKAGRFRQNGRCVPCPVGTYKAAAGDLACTACSGGKTTAGPGSMSSTACGTTPNADWPVALAPSGVHNPALPRRSSKLPSLAGSGAFLPARSAHGWCRLLQLSGFAADAQINGVYNIVPGAIRGARPIYQKTGYVLRADLDGPTVTDGGAWVLWAASSISDTSWWKERAYAAGSVSEKALFLQALNSSAPWSLVGWKNRQSYQTAWVNANPTIQCVCDQGDAFSDTVVGGCSSPIALPSPFAVAPLAPACPAGFSPAQGGGCQDINECARTPSVCSASTTCTNLPGSFRCSCPAGSAPHPNAPSLCQACAVGTFSTDGTDCEACPTDTTTQSTGATAPSACVCKDGAYRVPGSSVCVAPDTMTLRSASEEFTLVRSPVFLPAHDAAMVAALGLNRLADSPRTMGNRPIGSAALAALASHSSLPMAWGRSSPAGQCFPRPGAPWWMGQQAVSMSGYVMDPQDVGINAVARAIGLLDGRLVRWSDGGTILDGAFARPGVGVLADLNGFVMRGDAQRCNATSFIFSRRQQDTQAQIASSVTPNSDSVAPVLSQIGGQFQQAFALKIPFMSKPLIQPGAARGAVFARPAASERQTIDGPVLAMGLNPRDDGYRVAVATNKEETARALVGASSWQPTGMIPTNLAHADVQVYNGAARSFSSRGWNTSVSFAGVACVSLASPAGGLAHAACGPNKFLTHGCAPAIAGVTPTGHVQVKPQVQNDANVCAACRVCGKDQTEVAPCTGLSDTVCRNRVVPVDACWRGQQEVCGAQSQCGKCQVGAWCGQDADCEDGAQCGTLATSHVAVRHVPNGKRGMCIPRSSLIVSRVNGVGNPPLRQGVWTSTVLVGHALRAHDLGHPRVRRALEEATEWSIHSRTSGRARVVAQVIASWDITLNRTAPSAAAAGRAEFLRALIEADAQTPAGTSIAPPASTDNAGDLFESIDRFGLVDANTNPVSDLFPLLPNIAPAPRNMTMVQIMFRLLPVRMDQNASFVRAPEVGGAEDAVASGRERETADQRASIRATVTAATAAMVDTSDTSSLAALTRGLLAESSPAERSFAARALTVAGMGVPMTVATRSLPDHAVASFKGLTTAAFAQEAGATQVFAGSAKCPIVRSSDAGERPADVIKCATDAPRGQSTPCVLSEPRLSNCSSACGDGGYQFSFSTILALPTNGGEPCPRATDLIQRQACPSSIAASLPTCSGANSPSCFSNQATCGSSALCGLCGLGALCTDNNDCATTAVSPLVCRERVSGAGKRCLAPVPAANTPRSVVEKIPPLSDDVSSDRAPQKRQPKPQEKAGGIVLQLKLTIRPKELLSRPKTSGAVTRAIRALVLASLSRNDIEVVVDLLASESSSSRRLQSSSDETVVAVGLSAPNTLIAEASQLAQGVSQSFTNSTDAVEAAVTTAVIEDDPAAAASLQVDADDAVLFVVTGEDGFVVAGSPSVMAALSEASGAPPAVTPEPAFPVGAVVGGVIGGIVLVLGVFFLWRRVCQPNRAKAVGALAGPAVESLQSSAGQQRS
jgi:hypothetical protein